MSTKLHKNPTIHTLAIDLNLKVTTDPVAAIKEHCHRQIKRFLKDFPHCSTLNDLLAIAAQKLGTVFHEIHCDADLEPVMTFKFKLLKTNGLVGFHGSLGGPLGC